MNTKNEYGENVEKIKRKIISQIILKKQDVLSQLKEFVEGAKHFISIEETTGRVIFSPKFRLTNKEKIFLLLLGKYLAAQYGILNDHTLTLRDISEELKIKRTTLSAPLSRLIKDKIINKPEENRYEINPFAISFELNRLKRRYLEGSDRKWKKK